MSSPTTSPQNAARVSAAPRRQSATLRQRILTFVAALIVLSLLGSTISLYRITEVDRFLDQINRVSVPLGRLFTQIQSDADLYQRELERSLGSSHWKDNHWRPRPMPRWISDVLDSEIGRISELVQVRGEETTDETANRWQEWAQAVSRGLVQLRDESTRLQQALEQKDDPAATRIYAHWNQLLEEWKRQLQWGASEYDHSFRQTFSQAEKRVSQLRTGLEMILLVVISLSLLLLWLGERALRPLGELTRLAREITRRGLKKEVKSLFPEIPISRTDEVSQLAREFHNMATALLEREKMVESQKNRLQEQNAMLMQMGELNENVLKSFEAILIVTDLDGVITQCNPVAARWLEAGVDEIKGKPLLAWARVARVLDSFPEAVQWIRDLRAARAVAVAPFHLRLSGPAPRPASGGDDRVYGGHLTPLRSAGNAPGGAILVLEDLTDELDLQERLHRAENLAAVGRLSAQVAHEVRNPLHSIGLEAEMAAEMAARLGNPQLRQSLQSILGSVDRLDKITENYLKLSRLSAGEKTALDVGEVLETVLATYTSVCEAQQVLVDWRRESAADLQVFGDRALLEQVLGNLFRNSLQALEGSRAENRVPRIWIGLGATPAGKVWLRLEDNGPGIPDEVRAKLFVPFVTTRAQGTGLGLSFVKKVIEDHGGSIALRDRPAQSGSPARGACFEIQLPAFKSLPEARTAPGPAQSAQAQEAIHHV